MAVERAVVLHSSWRGRFTAAAGPAVLLIWGGYGVVAGGLQVFNGLLLAAGSALGLIVLVDFPIWSSIGPEGVVRRCVLRKERLGWDRVGAIARPGARQRLLGIGRTIGDRQDAKRADGRAGLVAEIGRRPYLLVDRIESPMEHDAIRKGLTTWSADAMLRASKPVDGTAPTWLYKRRKSEIEGMVDRR